MQCVKLFEYKSDYFSTSSEVPQIGNLSLLLFVLFINSVNAVLSHNHILEIADDMKIFSRISSIDDLLKRDLDSFIS